MPEADASVIIKRVACQLFIIKKEKGKESMKIAVTYDNGEVFQHFGRTENFKVYEIEDNKVISSEVISSNGVGHGALAGVLADRNVKALICGGIGGGAINALTEAGIEVCSGASGDTDKAVEDYLNGKLIDAGQTCDHHGEGHTCGDHEEDMDADIMMQRKITVADAVPMKEQRAEKAVDAAVENAARSREQM